MEVEGITQFFTDLGVDAQSDIITLLLSYYMGATTMGTYSFEEFNTGLTKLGVGSVEELKKKIPQLQGELRDANKFKELYKFVFDFCKD